MLRAFLELFWPILQRATAAEIADEREGQRRQIEQIEAMAISAEADLAYEAARTVYEEETERVKSADNKAFQYLLVCAAIISLLTYLESAIWDGKLGTAPRWVSLSVLLVAVAYLIRAALWSLGVLTTRTHHLVGASDIVEMWTRRSPRSRLTKNVLIATIQNHDGINRKISCVKMATAFLSRAIMAFGVLLFIEIVWELANSIFPWVAAGFATMVQSSSELVSKVPGYWRAVTEFICER